MDATGPKPPLRRGAARALAWRRSGAGKREFVLLADGAVLATMWTSGYAGTRGELDAAGQRSALRGQRSALHGQRFALRGTLHGQRFALLASGRRVTVTDVGSGWAAELRRTWTGASGVVELPGGERLTWARARGWRSRYLLTDQAGNRLAGTTARGGLRRFEATVQVDPAAASRPDLLPLLGLAWFTMVVMRNQPVVAA